MKIHKILNLIGGYCLFELCENTNVIKKYTFDKIEKMKIWTKISKNEISTQRNSKKKLITFYIFYKNMQL